MSINFKFFLFLVFLIVNTNTAFASKAKDIDPCAKLTMGAEEKTILIEWVELEKNWKGKVDLNSMLNNKLWRKSSSVANRKVMIQALMEQKDVHASEILQNAIQSASYIAPRVDLIKEVLETRGEDRQMNRILSDEFGLAVMFGNDDSLYQNEVNLIKRGRTPVMTMEQLNTEYQNSRRPFDDYLLIISTVLDMVEEDFFGYEFDDSELRSFEAGDINFLRYAIRHAHLDVLSVVVNHKRYRQTQNLKQAKVLLSDVRSLDIDSNAVKEGIRMAVYVTMTVEAFKRYEKTLGYKMRSFINSVRGN